MIFFFADDSKRNSPSRPGMKNKPFIAFGGISVPEDKIRLLQQEIDYLCVRYGFPEGEEFKWSPGRSQWMRTNLIEENRESFFIDLLTLIENHEIKAIVVIEEEGNRTATDASSNFMDATNLFLERVNTQLRRLQSNGLVIIDQPGGGYQSEESHLRSCRETLLNGTEYVKFDHIVLNVLSAHSHLSRFLQVADVITSCTLARVCGEPNYSLPVFEVVKRLFYSENGRVGGVGLKIYPDHYANLYHWLLGDSFLMRMNHVIDLPIRGNPYFLGSDNPRKKET